MWFDLTTIKLFLSIVEQRLIVGAATIAPPFVSHRISQLEMRLETTLILRQTKGVTPTLAGDSLARHVRNLSH